MKRDIESKKKIFARDFRWRRWSKITQPHYRSINKLKSTLLVIRSSIIILYICTLNFLFFLAEVMLVPYLSCVYITFSFLLWILCIHLQLFSLSLTPLFWMMHTKLSKVLSQGSSRCFDTLVYGKTSCHFRCRYIFVETSFIL